jgi:cytochrome b561
MQRVKIETLKISGVFMQQYSKRMVIVHWLTLLLLVTAYFMGDTLDEARHAGEATVQGYLVHALAGGAVLLLLALRLIFRRVDKMPPAPGNSLMDRVAKAVHHSLYVLLALLPASGLMIILTSGVGKALLSFDPSLLPAKYSGASMFPHNLHGALVTVLFVLLAVHILGALKHQFIMKDGLMRRMTWKR